MNSSTKSYKMKKKIEKWFRNSTIFLDQLETF
jgi:hypothetical protein